MFQNNINYIIVIDIRIIRPYLFYFTDKWTEIDIIANAVLMFVAGAETVSILTCFCLYELALNKEVQDRLREEIVTTKAKYGGNLNNNFLTDLRYMNMVLEGIINNNKHVLYYKRHRYDNY